jgi:hypothetical protein
MPRWTTCPLADRTVELANRIKACPACSRPNWAAAKPQRSVTTLDGVLRLHLQLRSSLAEGSTSDQCRLQTHFNALLHAATGNP